jgi:NADP-dependent 3-hydroxy acid dehydrogenase YdfG
VSERKTIFITGAGSGIGRAVAQHFAQRGWFVGLYDVNEAGIAETASPIPANQRTSMAFDVRDGESWARAVAAFGEITGGKMHVLFNNAGVGRGGPIDQMSAADIDLVLDVNLRGVVHGVVAALPLLKQTQGARILNTASVAGVIGAPGMSIYCASKFGVRGLTESLDAELAQHGIRAMSLMPWFLDTAILDNTTAQSNQRLRDTLREGAVPVYPVSMAAERAWQAVHSNGADIHFMVGQEAERARLAARFFPNLTRAQIKKRFGRPG